MKILSIGSDRKLFEADSAVRNRIISYGTLVEQLHIIVFSLERHGLEPQRLSDNVWVYPTQSLSRWFYVHDAYMLAKQQLSFVFGTQIDLVTAQDPFESGLAGYFIARMLRRQLQLQLHTNPFSSYFRREGFLNRIRTHIARWLLPRATCVRTVSPEVAKFLEAKYPSLVGRIQVLPVYVDALYYAEAKPSFDLHARYPQLTFIILMVSRLTKEKNISFALEVFARVQRRQPRAGLLIVGDGPLRKRLERQAEQLGIGPNVVFEPWQEELASHYKTANLYLLTSTYEGYGMTLVEAASAGLPFVTSDVGVAQALSDEAREAMVCPVGDHACFEEKINSYVGNVEKRASFALNIRDSVVALAADSKEEHLQAMKDGFERCLTQP